MGKHKPRNLAKAAVIELFWSKVHKTNSCWNWIGSVSKKGGYGLFWIPPKINGNYWHHGLVHRMSYELSGRKVPKGLVIDHLCRNRRCVNPDHLEAVSHRVNILRGVGPTATNIKKTHCLRGHLLTKDNVYISKRNLAWRECRTCALLRDKLRKRAPERGPRDSPEGERPLKG